MKITIPADTLKSALSKCRSVINRRMSLPVLDCALLTASEGRLSVKTNSLESVLSVEAACEVKQSGSVAVHCDRLLRAADSMDGDVGIDVDDKNVAHIRSGHGNVRLHGLPESDFPLQNGAHSKDVRMVIVEGFSAAISRVVPAMAHPSQGRNNLECVLLEIGDSSLSLVACSGRCLFQAVLPADTGNEQSSAIISADAAKIISQLTDGTIDLHVDSNSIHLDSDGAKFSSQLLEGSYPNYKTHIPNASDTKGHFGFKRMDALEALSVVNITADPSVNKLLITVTKSEIKFATRTKDVGASERTLPNTNPAGEIEFGVSYPLFRSALQSCSGEEITVDFIDTVSQFVIREPGFIALVMPMRVKTE